MKTLSFVFSFLFTANLCLAQESASPPVQDPAPEAVPETVMSAEVKVKSAVVAESTRQAAALAADGEAAASAEEAVTGEEPEVVVAKTPEPISYNRGQIFDDHHRGMVYYYRDGEEMVPWDYSAKLLTLLIECRGPGGAEPAVYQGAVIEKGSPVPAFSSDTAVPILHRLQEAGTSEKVVKRYLSRGFCADYKNEKEREDRRRNIKPRGRIRTEKKSYYRNE